MHKDFGLAHMDRHGTAVLVERQPVEVGSLADHNLAQNAVAEVYILVEASDLEEEGIHQSQSERHRDHSCPEHKILNEWRASSRLHMGHDRQYTAHTSSVDSGRPLEGCMSYYEIVGESLGMSVVVKCVML